MSAILISSPGFAAVPVIDMHVHATFTEREQPVSVCPGNQPLTYPAVDPMRWPAGAEEAQCSKPLLSATKRADFEARTIRELRRQHVRRAVLLAKPDEIPEWQTAAPGMFVAATVPSHLTEQESEKVGALAADGKIAMVGEVGLQYAGIRADDPRAEPLWAMAEERDLPVGIHLSLGTTLTAKEMATDPYRAGLTTPFQLEEVLHKHPRLRIYIMHAASPLIDETIAMLFTYPSLYVDVSASDWNMPRAQFSGELKKLVDAGFSKRIMFGSDQTIFPESIGLAIDTIKQAPFLTAEQKRDILYNNAARFLRLTPEQIAADHRP